jgi:hypothetical protein
MLNHSFVLNAPGTYRDTMMYIQELVEEHCRVGESSKLKSMIPSIGPMFTPLPLAAAFDAYDKKYVSSHVIKCYMSTTPGVTVMSGDYHLPC